MVKTMNGQSWRQFLKFENIDACAILKAGHSIDYIESIYQTYLLLFPNLPKKCPFEKGIYSVKNVTLINPTDSDRIETGPDRFLVSSARLPNGIYRHTMRFYNQRDREGFMVYWHIENYDSMGEDRL